MYTKNVPEKYKKSFQLYTHLMYINPLIISIYAKITPEKYKEFPTLHTFNVYKSVNNKPDNYNKPISLV